MVDKLPTPIPLEMLAEIKEDCNYIRDETSGENNIMSSLNGSGLNDDTNNKDTSSDQDTIFTGAQFCNGTRHDSSEPCTKFENRCKPTLLGLVLDIISHV